MVLDKFAKLRRPGLTHPEPHEVIEHGVVEVCDVAGRIPSSLHCDLRPDLSILP